MKLKQAIFLFIFSLIFCPNIFSQKLRSEFNSEGYGTILNRTKTVYFLSFRTSNFTKDFFQYLSNEFGVPIKQEDFLVYKCQNKEWAKDKIIIRIEPSIQIDFDQSKQSKIFIFVETVNRKDLLIPKTRSFEIINKYFFDLYKKTVESSELEFSF